jgi:hypothetical protein
MSKIQNPDDQNVTPDGAIVFREFGFLSFEFVSDFEIRIFGFLPLALDVTNWREPHDWLADSRQFSRCDYFIDVFVSWTCFLGEACP